MNDNYVVRTPTSPDGVVGLNGWWYLLEENGMPSEYESAYDAKHFLLTKSGLTEEEIEEFCEILPKHKTPWGKKQ